MSNLDAFLQVIGVSEGTVDIPGSDGGYRTIVGSTVARPILMDSYADHPRRLIVLSKNLKSTAAGKFQILERYFDAYKTQLRLPDFSPSSQDAIATQMIREQRALPDVEAGLFDAAVAKCSNIWASLPGNGYGQHQNALADLRQAFVDAGGALT